MTQYVDSVPADSRREVQQAKKKLAKSLATDPVLMEWDRQVTEELDAELQKVAG